MSLDYIVTELNGIRARAETSRTESDPSAIWLELLRCSDTGGAPITYRYIEREIARTI
jgi:hypothetical protein